MDFNWYLLSLLLIFSLHASVHLIAFELHLYGSCNDVVLFVLVNLHRYLIGVELHFDQFELAKILKFELHLVTILIGI